MNPHRESLSCIVPGMLYMGSMYVAQKTGLLLEYGISHVISLGDAWEHEAYEITQDKTGVITYHRIVLDDKETEELPFEVLDAACDFIKTATSPVFVHCWAGISRSTTIVLAYLMKHQGKSLFEAFALAKKARPIVMPNLKFMSVLQEFEKRK